jgi:hypothetical protein
MAELRVTRKKKNAAAYYAALALIGAAVLAGLGFVRERSLAQSRNSLVQLTMVCVSGFSWDRVMPLHQSGKLSFLAQLFRGRGSFGDSISYTSDTDAAITASLFTGRFPAKHAISREEDFTKLLSRDSFQTPVWQELIDRGQQCMVVGLPFSPNREYDGCISVSRRNMGSSAASISEEHLQRITRGFTVPADLLPLLRECISSDLERMQQAVQARAACRGLHLFAYFQGLGRWQQQLRAHAGAIPESIRAALIDNYYIFFDGILARLFSQCTSNGIFVVLSERGNSTGHPAYANQVPDLRDYPATGFFYAAGQHIREGIEPLVIAPADVAPTLLCLAGISSAQPMDGRVTFKLLEEHYYFKRKIIGASNLILR